MIFVDASVFLLAIGKNHPLRTPAREFFANAREFQSRLAVSSEVLQEMLYVYRRRNEVSQYDVARELIDRHGFTIWSLESEDVDLARMLSGRYPDLEARDLCHLATCRRRAASQLKTFDQALGDAFNREIDQIGSTARGR